MSERVADVLVVAFSDGESLRTWEESGILEREWAIYDRLRGHVGRIVLVTYGGPDDGPLAQRLGAGLVCNADGVGREEYLSRLPAIVAAQAGRTRRTIVKTNQMCGGDGALAVVRGLRSPERTV